MNHQPRIRFKIQTYTDDEKKILQRLNVDIEDVCERVMDTQEDSIRKSLIALGWTPPVDVSQPIYY